MKIGSIVFEMYRLPRNLRTHGFIKGDSVKTRTPLLGACFHIADRRYRLSSLKQTMKICKLNRFSEMPFVPEDRDCDDFAIALWSMMRKLMPGFANGLIWVDQFRNGKLVGKHALNFFLDFNWEVYLIEPQSNTVFRLPKNWKPILVVI